MPELNFNPNIEYLKTPRAILKIVQIVTLLIAFSCITNCCDGGAPYAPDARYNGIRYVSYWSLILGARNQQKTVTPSEVINYNRNTAFFQAVTILGWLLVVFFFVFFFLNLHERFNQINWEMLSMVISTVWSVLLLLCCSLMGNISSTAFTMRLTRDDFADINGFLKSYIDTMVAGVSFGFFAFIAFIVEAVLLFWQFWSKRKARNNSPPVNPAARKVLEAPGPSRSTTQDQTRSQILPTQTSEAPPKFETVPNLPGQTIQHCTGQTVPYSTGQTAPYTTGQIVPHTTAQTVPHATGQAAPYTVRQTARTGQGMIMYPPGQHQY